MGKNRILLSSLFFLGLSTVNMYPKLVEIAIDLVEIINDGEQTLFLTEKNERNSLKIKQAEQSTKRKRNANIILHPGGRAILDNKKRDNQTKIYVLDPEKQIYNHTYTLKEKRPAGKQSILYSEILSKADSFILGADGQPRFNILKNKQIKKEDTLIDKAKKKRNRLKKEKKKAKRIARKMKEDVGKNI